jgi:CENP-B-like protein
MLRGQRTFAKMANTPKKRTSLAIEDKIAIAKYANAHPGETHADLGQRFGYKRSTVSKILKNKSKWLAWRLQLRRTLTPPSANDSEKQSSRGWSPAPPSISDARARAAVDDLLTWAEQNVGTLSDAEKHHEALLALSDAIRKLAIRNAPQCRITDYFSMGP